MLLFLIILDLREEHPRTVWATSHPVEVRHFCLNQSCRSESRQFWFRARRFILLFKNFNFSPQKFLNLVKKLKKNKQYVLVFFKVFMISNVNKKCSVKTWGRFMFRVINLDPDPQLCRLASYLNLNAQIQSEGVKIKHVCLHVSHLRIEQSTSKYFLKHLHS